MAFRHSIAAFNAMSVNGEVSDNIIIINDTTDMFDNQDQYNDDSIGSAGSLANRSNKSNKSRDKRSQDFWEDEEDDMSGRKMFRNKCKF